MLLYCELLFIYLSILLVKPMLCSYLTVHISATVSIQIHGYNVNCIGACTGMVCVQITC